MRVLSLLIASFLAIPLWVDRVIAEDKQLVTVGGVPAEEALRLGEKMYREGILPSGEPLQAVVQGDIPVDGRMFTCVSCHQRSGMGSPEGNVITFPIDGVRLYRPMSKMGNLSASARSKLPKMLLSGDMRPAYTDETLARALRAGEDPAGRKFNEVMPRYFLNDRDMEIMVFYLKRLSTDLPPGVTDTTLRLATVITDEVSAQDREAMLGPLQFFARTWGQSRHLARRAKIGPFTEEVMDKGYRKLLLDVWELHGPPEGWRSQLEEYYRKGPVFALAGGVSTKDWAPIHRFCEDHRIPALFPVTDYPVVSEADWYTLYFSKGLYQEGEAAARYLHSITDGAIAGPVIQVFRNDRAGGVLGRAFEETWESLGHKPFEKIVLGNDETLGEDFWKRLVDLHRDAVFVLWLPSRDLSAIGALAEVRQRPRMVFASSSLLGRDLFSLPDKARSFIYVTYPYRLPQDDKDSRAGVEAWLKNTKIPVTNILISSKMYDLVSVISNPLSMLKGYFYRDRFLEVMDMMPDQWSNIALYPRLSFGPGQRYASKGCYIVQITEGPQPELVRRSEWVIH